jgi:1,2-phenylacetyl-CoA epoxidase PaaB subunit
MITLPQAIKLGLTDPTGENAKRFEALITYRNALQKRKVHDDLVAVQKAAITLDQPQVIERVQQALQESK